MVWNRWCAEWAVQLGQPEVEDLDRTVGSHLDIRRLEVAMNDALLMGRFERLGNLLRDGQRAIERNRVHARHDAHEEIQSNADDAGCGCKSGLTSADKPIQSTGGRLRVGTFRTRCRIENPIRRSKQATISSMLVDTGSEYTWVPAKVLERLAIGREKKDVQFVMANGEQITRSVGFAILRVDGFFTIDEVVFGEPGDLNLLGARTLEGLNLRVDSRRKRLVAAGPVPAAASA